MSVCQQCHFILSDFHCIRKLIWQRERGLYSSQVCEPVLVLLWRQRGRPDVPGVDEAAVLRDVQRRRLAEHVALGRKLVGPLRYFCDAAGDALGGSGVKG